ncbi:MAG: hypothetical protein KC488_09065 [Candidatus Cloacimonetes bacterium]|nr:hypothetical protein [Candidatus Cloacimonadota bacterium]
MGQTEVDCNQNGFFDEYELATGAAEDCNGNGIPDACDIASGDSMDLDGDGIPDECESAAGCVTLDISSPGSGQTLLQWSAGEGCPVLHGPCRLLVSDDPDFPGGGTVLYQGHATSFLDTFDPETPTVRCYRVEVQR